MTRHIPSGAVVNNVVTHRPTAFRASCLETGMNYQLGTMTRHRYERCPDLRHPWIHSTRSLASHSVRGHSSFLLRGSYQTAISRRYHVGMVAKQIGETLQRRRHDAGLTQRDLALRSGVPQPNIAAYETGRRTPAVGTLERLDRVLNAPTFQRLRARRELIIRAAEDRGLSNVRVFGSVARGEADAGSDLDLLVHPSAEASLFDLAGFLSVVEELLGLEVDVVSDRGRGPVMDRIRAEAVPL